MGEFSSSIFGNDERIANELVQLRLPDSFSELMPQLV
jgi:hypothetical protein